MLNFEKELEAAEKEHMKVITCGDFNCESGNLVCHEIFDALPFEKLLDEPTLEDKKLNFYNIIYRNFVVCYVKRIITNAALDS